MIEWLKQFFGSSQQTEAVAVAPEQVRVPPEKGWSKSIEDCHVELRRAFPKVRDEFESAHPDCRLLVDYTYRSPEVQFELYKKGRTILRGQWVVTDPKHVVTQKDGLIKRSEHNFYPSRGADIYVVKNGKILWGTSEEEHPYYVELGRLWEREGIVSGATWKYAWKDFGHVQVAQA